jgi:Helix-turn-helix domain
MARAFTSADIEELRRRAEAGESVRAIAQHLSRSYGVISKVARRHGIKLARSWCRQFTDKQIETMRLMAEVGHPAAAIARQIGKRPASVRWKLSIRTRQRQSRSGRHRILFKVDDALWRRCAAAAKGRNVTITELARLLIGTAVSDDLVDAVLDVPVPKASVVPAKRPRVPEVSPLWSIELNARRSPAPAGLRSTRSRHEPSSARAEENEHLCGRKKTATKHIASGFPHLNRSELSQRRHRPRRAAVAAPSPRRIRTRP